MLTFYVSDQKYYNSQKMLMSIKTHTYCEKVILYFKRGVNMTSRLKELRQKNNLTLKELGKKVGMLDSTLSQYENGKRNPNDKVWQKLADFFNVSLDYIKNKYYSTHEIVEIINEFYFLLNSDEDKKSSLYDDVKLIDSYVSITSHDEIPSEFYKLSSKTHPLTQKMEKYWLNHFKKIFESKEFTNIPKNQQKNMFISKPSSINFEKSYIFNKFCWDVRSELDDIKKDVPLTNLGAFYRMNFANENKLHSEAIDKIEYYDLPVARKAIDQYAEVINDLRNKANSIDDNEEYLNKYFENIINKQLVDEKFHTKFDKKDFSDIFVGSNEIVQEAKQRVESGNKDLRDYIIKHSENKDKFHYDFLDDYRKYKVNHNEDTSKIDNLNKQFEAKLSQDE